LSSSSNGPAESPGPGSSPRTGGTKARARISLILLAALPAAGCLATGGPEVRKDLDALRGQIAEIQKANAQIASEVEQLREARSSSGPAGTDAAALDARIGSLEGQLAALRQRLEDAQDRMNSFSADLQSTRELAVKAQPPRTAPSQPPEGDLEAQTAPGSEESATGLEDSRPGGGVEDTYSAAYADFTKGSYALAIAGFQEFLRRYPGSELADNAQFWIAESYYSQGEFDAAGKEYDVVIQKYPKGDRVPAAYLKKSLCLMETSRTAEAVVLMQHLIQTYPTSEEAALARDRLQGMGVKP
jgi:tol-pal system protein YbgF